MAKKKKKEYSDFSNARSLQDNLIPEEFPEGPFGSSIGDEKLAYSKTTPWKEDQHRQSAFVYSDKELHEDLPRKAPGAHLTHDEPDDANTEQEEQ